MKKKYTPYNFDKKIEYKIYSKIGESYYNQFKGNKSKKYKRYPDVDKYMEWKSYFKNKYSTNAFNDCNFIHYLNRLLRIYQRNLEIYKSVEIPLFISEITIFMSIYAANHFPMQTLINVTMLVLILTACIGIYLILGASRKVNFYVDCINVIDSNFLSVN